MLLAIVLLTFFVSCKQAKTDTVENTTLVNDWIPVPLNNAPFAWEGANIYFLLTDRFKNGDTLNDVNFKRTEPTGPLRGFMGGDIAGITSKIEQGYFSDLGVNAIWFTPVVEQVHGSTDEETGNT